MSDQGKSADDITLQVKGHTYRIRFEAAALCIIVGVAVLACLGCAYIVIMGTKDMADKMAELTGSVVTYLGLLATATGMSWTRGHFDKRDDQ